MATMIAYTSRLNAAEVGPHRIGRYWAARGEDLFLACARDRDRLPAGQSMDVRFDEFMADDLGTIEKIYQLADQPMSEVAREAMTAFVAEHARGRHGGIRYRLEDLGLDGAERRAALASYVAHFGVREEFKAGG
jgi:hypothetical protein